LRGKPIEALQAPCRAFADADLGGGGFLSGKRPVKAA
jgi:hypothetical protein